MEPWHLGIVSWQYRLTLALLHDGIPALVGLPLLLGKEILHGSEQVTGPILRDNESETEVQGIDEEIKRA